MFPELKKYLDSFLPMGVPGFDMLIYQNGQCIWRYMNGFYVVQRNFFHPNSLPDSAGGRRERGTEKLGRYFCRSAAADGHGKTKGIKNGQVRTCPFGYLH